VPRLTIPPRRRLVELLRYYQAALINTAFGFGLYALLVWLGLNMFAAQIIAHVCGVQFNYFSYRHIAFRERHGRIGRFVAAYVVHYLVNLALLALLAMLVASPYQAGLLATLAASLINYFVLRHLVFMDPAKA
jgi:putative flippase GtrA